MKKILLILCLLLFASFSFSAECEIGIIAPSADYTAVMLASNTQNAHAATLSAGTYAYKVWCPNSVMDAYTVVEGCDRADALAIVSLSSPSNAHVEVPEAANYPLTICLSSSVVGPTCTARELSCAANEFGVVSLWDGTWVSGDPVNNLTNAHIANYSYSNYPVKICCSNPPTGGNDVFSIKLVETVSGTPEFPPGNLIIHADVANISGAAESNVNITADLIDLRSGVVVYTATATIVTLPAFDTETVELDFGDITDKSNYRIDAEVIKTEDEIDLANNYDTGYLIINNNSVSAPDFSPILLVLVVFVVIGIMRRG